MVNDKSKCKVDYNFCKILIIIKNSTIISIILYCLSVLSLINSIYVGIYARLTVVSTYYYCAMCIENYNSCLASCILLCYWSFGEVTKRQTMVNLVDGYNGYI